IFRHFEERKGVLGFRDRLDVIVGAVKEVRLPVIASTIASLVVFIPLAFTSELTYAVLGDLAKTVVFSHGFSAFVALILVPTVRLHLMSSERGRAPRSPIEGALRGIENLYARALGRFMARRRLRLGAYGGLAAGLGALLLLVL